MYFVFHPASSSLQENADPLEYVENNPPTNGWTFATGQVTGLSNSNGTYRYDLGIFVEDKMIQVYSMPGKMKIPVSTMGWESYGPSSAMVNNMGYIESETSNISYISNYNFYQNGWNEPWYPCRILTITLISILWGAIHQAARVAEQHHTPPLLVFPL